MLRKKKLSIKDKIKNYMNDVTIDVFGYEEKVTVNVLDYLKKLSEENGVTSDFLNIQIAMPGKIPKAHLHHEERYIREVPIKELVCFFAGEGTALLLNLESKISKNVSNYLVELADSKNIPLQSLNIKISRDKNQIVVEARNYGVFEESIPLKDLIKYFAR